MDENTKITKQEYKEKVLESTDRQMLLFYRIAQTDVLTSLIILDEMISKENIYGMIKNQNEKDILTNSHGDLIKSFNKHVEIIGDEETEVEVDRLLSIRQELYNLYSAINAYETEISYLSEQINVHMMKLSAKDMYKNIRIDEREIREAVDIVGNRLSDNTLDHNEFVETVSQVLGVLPFRITKFKYFNMIETTLKRNLHQYPISYVEEEIANYKLIFDSSLMGDYGILFDHYFAHIQKFKNINFKEKTYEELDNILDHIDTLWDKIEKIRKFVYFSGMLTNKLIGIYLIKADGEEDSQNEDLLKMWFQYQNHPREELLEELNHQTQVRLRLNEAFFQQEEEYLEELGQQIGEIDENIEREIEEKLKPRFSIYSYLWDVDFSKQEVLFPKHNQAISAEYLEQLVDSLIRYINRSLTNMGNAERRIRMRRLLATVTLPFTDFQEFMDYIEYSLDERVVSKEEILFTIDALHYMFDEEE